MASRNAVDLSTLTAHATITRRERGLLETLDRLLQPNESASPAVDAPPPATSSISPPVSPRTPTAPAATSSTSTTLKHVLFALCAACIQFALHYIGMISDTINGVFPDSAYIIKSLCVFLLAYLAYKHIDRLFG